MLTDEQQTLREEVCAFADEHVAPVAAEYDRRGEDIPRSLLEKIAERGWFGMTVAEQYGGLGKGMVEFCLVVESLARHWLSVASVVGRGNAILDDVLTTDEERERYLPRVARGELITAFALSEDKAGSDVANVQCRAEESGDGWVVRGSKKWCGFAERADAILLYARTDDPPEDKPYLGISAFLIEKERDTLPPATTGTPIDKIGYHGLTTWALEFEGLELSADALKGERGEAFYGIMQGLDRKRVYTGARATGVAQGALEAAVDYATGREQFDQQLAGFQAIRFKLADMATDIAAARALTYESAQRLDAGRDIAEDAAKAKLFATEMAERVTSQALQIHGGNGYTYDFPAQRHWRDARLTTIFEGTSEIQRRIISDRLLP